MTRSRPRPVLCCLVLIAFVLAIMTLAECDPAHSAPVNRPWHALLAVEAPNGRLGVVEDDDSYETAEACGLALAKMGAAAVDVGLIVVVGECLVEGSAA